MIHIGTVMKVLGERKTFIKNHPDFLEFILRVFGGELEEGTVLEMRVIRPKQEAGDDAGNDMGLRMVGQMEQGWVELQASDKEFFSGMRELVREVVKE